MGRIAATFNRLKQKEQSAFIPFLMAGDPNLELTKELVLEAERKGADIIELGIPYSTPLADGPTIQKAGKRSLTHGTNLNDIFELVEEIRLESDIPLILMGYYNSVFSYGVEEFVNKSEEVGVDGVIIPDLPLGEDEELREYSTELNIILLVTPISTEKRLKEVAEASSGFIYAVSTSGTTGARTEVAKEVKGIVEKVKSLTSIPVAVGFGISKPEHVSEVGQFADGAIVGSAIIQKIEDNLDLISDNKDEFIQRVGSFIRALANN
ncbi:tryptophan synthase subunit alpha [Selenihalanaerobacter shriftii]|uniref:Tryptophan synthase alpha chain n=1 Tax=Selenihalanaerobacter shriftii TaxID=142842 RepID=A0A1T4JPN9_9FIRM|nr:tryptophan synthase subunit alpha [Selenihalanaerobacter shriftii]SJZ32113.1 tryptophan synthase, alpha chain [Selenihalanaerobacter shriftii]